MVCQLTLVASEFTRVAAQMLWDTLCRNWRDGDHRLFRMAVGSELYLFGNSQRVINLDPEVPNCAFQFSVSKEDLDSAQVTRLLVNQSCLGPSHRMGSIGGRLKTNAAYPSMEDARVLSSR